LAVAWGGLNVSEGYVLFLTTFQMITNDASKTQVVQLKGYRPSLGPLLKGRPATLEIDPSCEPILDEIIMTFVYCHKLRKDRERRARNSGGGGGP
jgi:hypothetical protein